MVSRLKAAVAAPSPGGAAPQTLTPS
jgi:hypothetical protein